MCQVARRATAGGWKGKRKRKDSWAVGRAKEGGEGTNTHRGQVPTAAGAGGQRGQNALAAHCGTSRSRSPTTYW
jgi:hypothetical protein